MRIAIVDDIKEERAVLYGWLSNQLSKGIFLVISLSLNQEKNFWRQQKRPFTVVFLDIYMNGANGIEIARELRMSDSDCFLIFTTTSTDHALEGFRVRALHYLVKPYNEKEISTLLDEILSRIPDSGKYIDVKVNGSNIQIPFKNIIYAEHFSHMIHIHTTGGKEMLTRQSFEAFTASLKMDSRFYSCNRGIVINLEHAVDFDGSMFLMDDDNNIPVSRKLLKMQGRLLWNFCFSEENKMSEIMRPILEIAVIIPGMLLAYLPVKACLRQAPFKLGLWMFPLLLGISLSGGIVCYYFQIMTTLFLIPVLLFLMLLYHKTLQISIWKSSSIFLAVCAVFACVKSLSRAVNAIMIFEPDIAEKQLWLCVKAGIFYNLICLSFVLIAWYPATHMVRILIADENFAQTWYIFWILPLIFIGLNQFISQNIRVLYIQGGFYRFT